MSKRALIGLVTGVVLSSAIAVLVLLGTAGQRTREQAADLYQARCALCHELEGGIGAPLDPRVLASYGSARLLFNYVRLAMPYDAPRTLSDEDYWLTVGHLLRSRGLVDEDRAVNEETAEGIALEAGTN